MEIQDSDSEGTNYLKTAQKYTTAKANILKAKNKAVREIAINLALKYREALKDRIRAKSHDEL